MSDYNEVKAIRQRAGLVTPELLVLTEPLMEIVAEDTGVDPEGFDQVSKTGGRPDNNGGCTIFGPYEGGQPFPTFYRLRQENISETTVRVCIDSRAYKNPIFTPTGEFQYIMQQRSDCVEESTLPNGTKVHKKWVGEEPASFVEWLNEADRSIRIFKDLIVCDTSYIPLDDGGDDSRVNTPAKETAMKYEEASRQLAIGTYVLYKGFSGSNAQIGKVVEDTRKGCVTSSVPVVIFDPVKERPYQCIDRARLSPLGPDQSTPFAGQYLLELL